MVSPKQCYWYTAFALVGVGASACSPANRGQTQTARIGAAHEFFGMATVVDDAKAAQEQAAAGLQKGF